MPTFCRPGQQTKKFLASIQPEVPDGPQYRRKRTEKHNASAQGTQQNEPSQLSVCLMQCEKKQRGSDAQTVEKIQQSSELWKPLPYCPQQIVQNTDRQAKQNGQTENAKLSGDLECHGII